MVAGHPNGAVVQVDPFIHGREDFTNSIRHYSRRVYRDLALEISRRIGGLEVAAAGPAGRGAAGCVGEGFGDAADLVAGWAAAHGRPHAAKGRSPLAAGARLEPGDEVVADPFAGTARLEVVGEERRPRLRGNGARGDPVERVEELTAVPHGDRHARGDVVQQVPPSRLSLREGSACR